MSRQRINLSVPEETYQDLLKIKNEYHFKNACEVAATLLQLFLTRVRKVGEADPMPEDEEAVIRSMFEEYGQTGPRPEAFHAPRIKRTRTKRAPANR